MAGVVMIVTQEVKFFCETLSQFLNQYGYDVVTVPFSKQEVRANIGTCDVVLLEADKSQQGITMLDLVASETRSRNLAMCVAGYSDDLASLTPQLTNDMVARTFERPCDIADVAHKIGAFVDNRSSDDPIDRLRNAGLNTQTALQYTGDSRDFYLEIVKGYVREAAGMTDRLTADYVKANWDDYAIAVHSLKGSSRTIGATDLGELAFSLEMAAREHRETDIRNEHDAFLSSYSQTVHDICAALGWESTLQPPLEHVGEVESQKQISNELPSISRDEFVRHLADARACLETFEVERAEAHVQKSAERALDGSPTTPLLADVLRCLEEFDVDGAVDILTHLIERMS